MDGEAWIDVGDDGHSFTVERKGKKRRGIFFLSLCGLVQIAKILLGKRVVEGAFIISMYVCVCGKLWRQGSCK